MCYTLIRKCYTFKLAYIVGCTKFYINLMILLVHLTYNITNIDMLDIDLQENLYARLDNEKKQGLISLVYKRSRQALVYFRCTKEVSLSKLEIIADNFHMPLDYFRVCSSLKLTILLVTTTLWEMYL